MPRASVTWCRLALVLVMLVSLPAMAAGTPSGGASGLTIFGSHSGATTLVLAHAIRLRDFNALQTNSVNPFTVTKGSYAGFRIRDAHGHTVLANLWTRVSGLLYPVAETSELLPAGRYTIALVADGATTITFRLNEPYRYAVAPQGPSKLRVQIADLNKKTVYEYGEGNQDLGTGRPFVLSGLRLRESNPAGGAQVTKFMLCITDAQSDCRRRDYKDQQGYFSGAGGTTSTSLAELRVAPGDLPAGTYSVSAQFLGISTLDSAWFVTMSEG